MSRAPQVRAYGIEPLTLRDTTLGISYLFRVPIELHVMPDGTVVDAGSLIMAELVAHNASETTIEQQLGVEGITAPQILSAEIALGYEPPPTPALQAARQQQGIQLAPAPSVLQLMQAPPPNQQPHPSLIQSFIEPPFATVEVMANPPENYWENFNGLVPAVSEYGDWELGRINYVSTGGGGIVGSRSGIRFGTLERIVFEGWG